MNGLCSKKSILYFYALSYYGIVLFTAVRSFVPRKWVNSALISQYVSLPVRLVYLLLSTFIAETVIAFISKSMALLLVNTHSKNGL